MFAGGSRSICLGGRGWVAIAWDRDRMMVIEVDIGIEIERIMGLEVDV